MSAVSVFHEIWHSKEIRKRILFTLFAIAVFRLAGHIPVPGTDPTQLQSLFAGNQLLSIFSLLTGGGLEQLSVVMMGISPYITASIIVQLLTVAVPKWEQLAKEGERGQRIISKWTRVLTVPIAFLQSYSFLQILHNTPQGAAIFPNWSTSSILYTMFLVTAGTMFLMWLGELITEKGLGNGISILIFAGIVAGIPNLVGGYYELIRNDPKQLAVFAVLALFTILLIAVVVFITEGRRQVPITYARASARGVSGSSHLPIQVNQAGMIPIIFAVSLLAVPSLLANFLQNAKTAWVAAAARWTIANFVQTSWYYVAFYFLLIVLFTYFYVSVAFNPVQVAENIQKRGGFIPGIRPGKHTVEHLRNISRRLTLFGALFIAIVAVLPLAVGLFSSGTQASNVPALVSGAGIIIVVGVVLELVRQLNAQLLMQDYEKFA